MSSLLEKRRLKALAEGKDIPQMTLMSVITSDSLIQNNIDLIKKEYIEIKQYYFELDLEKERNIEEIRDIDCVKLMSGARKTVSKCMKFNVVELSSLNKLQLTIEILNHIRVLKIFYELKKTKDIKFKIPKIYLPKDLSNITRYFLDYIDIDEKYIKLAKFHNFIDPDILKNIGNLIGEYAKKYNRLLHDFELYIDKTDNIPTLLDFGESKEINEKIEQTYTRMIYDGIIESYEILKDKNIKPSDDTSLEYLEKSKHVHKKYLKYKQKYLELKRNIFIE
jgi:hypothetical protein